jgi:NAD+ synthase
VVLTRWTRGSSGWQCAQGTREIIEEDEEADYAACTLGLKDYVDKNGFKGVVLGLSGGIDSAICAAMAVDALGPARVRCLMMPYRYTSQDSLKDAFECAKALGVTYEIVPIEPVVAGFQSVLAPLFAGRDADITEENMQSRARGTILMSVSNKFGPMVITTGNKSEMSVGYCTLYGDMNGGFNPIKDLYKMEVYRLSALRNRWKPQGSLGPDGVVIPDNIITKAPTAELRENQKDQDSLPEYEVLDDILNCLVEQEMRVADIVARGHALEVVLKVAAPALSRRVQAPSGRARRQGDAPLFWPRSALSDRQSLPRCRAGQRAWFTLHRRGAFGADCEDRRRILARAHAKVLFRLLSGVIVGLVLMIAGANLR